MVRVTCSQRVAGYNDLLKRLARRFVGFGNAELDDLMQEGRISVWKALEAGVKPSKAIIERRMIGWVRYLRRLMHNDAVAYERLLSFEVDYDPEA